MHMNKKILLLPLLLLLPLTSCNRDAKYALAYDGIEKLQTLLDDPDDIEIKHAFHGTPPVTSYGTIVLMIYEKPSEGVTGPDHYFAYENETTYYDELDAVPLYEYREYYVELDSDVINEHFGF